MTPDERNKSKRDYTLFRALFIASKMLCWNVDFMKKYGARCWKSYYMDGLTPEKLADRIVAHAESPSGIEYYADPDGCSC